ncbi:MAG: cytochrome C [Rhodanobacteraceae bacterium]|jgi:mono/diheme cytochrome c family protein|nr:cytochrome C [Rhodanobacteraceae bacterium]
MSKSLLGAALLLAASCAGAAGAPPAADAALIQQGRYLSVIGGCNDCHTPGFGLTGGKVPEAQWLLGDKLGFSGPWGTTYPANVRLRLATMDLAAFKTYARALTTRPPMPYWALNTMSDHDLEALYAFVKSLGTAGDAAPAALPPGVQPKGPVVTFPGPPPAAATAQR